jgi:hypothetical protein
MCVGKGFPRTQGVENMSADAGTKIAGVLASAPRDRWLALATDESKVVGTGRSLEEALQEAIKNGVQEPVMMWSPKSWLPTAY